MFSGIRKNIALFQGSQASPACPPEKISIRIEISMEYWWNGIVKGKRKDPEKNLISVTLPTTNVALADVQLIGVWLPRLTV